MSIPTRRRQPTHVTPFQQRVYAVVKTIPTGEVRSYRWVAEQLGNPKLARAVGQALKRNPCLRRACQCRAGRGRQAWLQHVPCHRVIRADGSLGGYAWGVLRKRRLLQHEGSPPRAPVRAAPFQVYLKEGSSGIRPPDAYDPLVSRA